MAAADSHVCMICDGPLWVMGPKAGFTYACCRPCGSVQLSPLPSQESLDRAYREGYDSAGHYADEPVRHRLARAPVAEQVADIIQAQHAADDDRLVVELGAGWGPLGSVLRSRGVPYLGIEPNTTMAEACKALGLDVLEGRLEEAHIERPVRCIASMAVFEHIADQRGILREMASRLDDGGCIVLQCPTPGYSRLVGRAYRALGLGFDLPGLFGSLAPPWHVCLPSPDGVRKLAADCGMTLAQVHPSRSGTGRGAKRMLQRVNDGVARAGHAWLGERFALSMAHVFVLKKLP